MASERAILEAVNNTKDNDTIASIVGAAVGAYHSLDGLPEHLVKNLSGRLSTTDDNKIFELIICFGYFDFGITALQSELCYIDF